MPDREKLQALRTRLLNEQRRIIHAAAERDGSLANGELFRVAHLEQTIMAVEAMLDEQHAAGG